MSPRACASVSRIRSGCTDGVRHAACAVRDHSCIGFARWLLGSWDHGAVAIRLQTHSKVAGLRRSVPGWEDDQAQSRGTDYRLTAGLDGVHQH